MKEVKKLVEGYERFLAQDFEEQKTIKDNTINCKYKDISIHQCPPNGPGITVLIMMQMMEKLKIENYKANTPERFHLEAEVTKLAYQLREENIGDPVQIYK